MCSQFVFTACSSVSDSPSVLNVIQILLVSKYAEALYLFETKTHCLLHKRRKLDDFSLVIFRTLNCFNEFYCTDVHSIASS